MDTLQNDSSHIKVGVNIQRMSIDGVQYLPGFMSEDQRGYFHKTYTKEWAGGLSFNLEELYATHSTTGTVRGMHLQTGTSDSWKIVTVIQGSIFDVVLDLRAAHKFGQIGTETLTPKTLSSVVIPPNVAHGFQALEDSLIQYATSFPYQKDFDTGVNIDSLNIEWPLPVRNRSYRDCMLGSISEWN